MNTIIFKNTSKLFEDVEALTAINVIDTCLPVSDCKKFAGTQFNANSWVTSASVIDENGTEVLLLEKDADGHCTKRKSL